MKISILDKLTSKQLEVFEFVFLYRFAESHLPELFEVFGKDKVVEFLDVFSGCRFRVPTRNEVERSVRDVDIYLSMETKRYDDKTSKVLADRYDITRDWVCKIHRQVKEEIGDRVDLAT